MLVSILFCHVCVHANLPLFHKVVVYEDIRILNHSYVEILLNKDIIILLKIKCNSVFFYNLKYFINHSEEI